ncbi:unnamed protein product [Caenorhabditis bovis]|uniref:Uncharacterized protein n=1 Tax=Caenorhabditis bovis TaxID=2654633 RepID=A0A8S1EU66_9PELO|nr:unnamed protein product [Caenorhabditis bovis]
MRFSMLHLMLAVIVLVAAVVVDAGTWLSFNDFKEDGLGEPVRQLGDVVTLCQQSQKRMMKRTMRGVRATRAEKENDAICRMLMKMVSRDQPPGN